MLVIGHVLVVLRGWIGGEQGGLFKGSGLFMLGLWEWSGFHNIGVEFI